MQKKQSEKRPPDRAAASAAGSALGRFLGGYAARGPVRFHMPGHKGARFFRKLGYGELLGELPDLDITEIPGADNLFYQEEGGVLREMSEQYRRIYGVRASFPLVNGSSCGLEAAIYYAARQIRPVFLTARNCHKAVFNGLEMAGAKTSWVYPEVLPEGISGPLTPEEAERGFREMPEAAALIVTSPNYYGIRSDIRRLAETAHRWGAILIVDQAHGAHQVLFDRVEGSRYAAENCGADIVIDSTHKTMASFTQTALVNLNGDRVDPDVFGNVLEKFESSSPSYLMMLSLAVNGEITEHRGEGLVRRWAGDLDWFLPRAKRIPGLRVLEHPMLDRTKIDLDMSRRGLNGQQLAAELERRGIVCEMASGNFVMCLSGIGNERRDYEQLLRALEEIAAAGKAGGTNGNAAGFVPGSFRLEQRDIPTQCEWVALDRAAGRVCGRQVTPYPPGIPAVCPGEVMTEAALEAVRGCLERGEEVMGIRRDPAENGGWTVYCGMK